MKSALQASKWLTVQALLGRDEMRELLNELGFFLIFQTGSVNKKGKSSLTKGDFLSIYETYLANHCSFEKPSFSAIFTRNADDLLTIPVEGEKELLRALKPVIQIQQHRIGYSNEEKKFRPMILGTDTISWGLQFAFPQLYQDPETQEIHKSDTLQNGRLFRTLQRWMRAHTIPTPFVVEGETINVPMRLGRECLSWINTHPQLIAKNIHVHRTSST